MNPVCGQAYEYVPSLQGQASLVTFVLHLDARLEHWNFFLELHGGYLFVFHGIPEF
jgi:hypothetical protein